MVWAERVKLDANALSETILVELGRSRKRYDRVWLSGAVNLIKRPITPLSIGFFLFTAGLV